MGSTRSCNGRVGFRPKTRRELENGILRRQVWPWQNSRDWTITLGNVPERLSCTQQTLPDAGAISASPTPRNEPLLALRRRLRSARIRHRRHWLRNPHRSLISRPRIDRDPAVRIRGRRRQSHRAWNEASDTSAMGNPQLCGARPTGKLCARPRSLQLHGEQLAISTARDPGSHARHVVGHIERMLALRRFRGARASTGHLFVGGTNVESSAVGGSGSRKLLELLLHRIVRFRCGGRGRNGRLFVAAGQAHSRDHPEQKYSVHDPIL